MKVRHLALMAVLFGTGWSTNVVYEYQTGSSLLRGIASEEITITVDNFTSQMEKLEENAKSLTAKHDKVKTALEKEDVNLKELISLRNKESKEIRDEFNSYQKLKGALDVFINENSGALKQEALKKVGVVHSNIHEADIYALTESNLKIKINELMEEETMAQAEAMADLQSSLCEQNKSLSSLTEKLEKLLEDKEEVVSEVSPQDLSSLFSSMAYPFAMTPVDFFSQPQQVGLQNQSNPFGLDMNFLMMTQMLTGSNGFGPRPSINYAPVYNNQRTYMGMPSLMHLGSGAQNHNNNVNPFPMMPGQRAQGLQGIESGFNFVPEFTRGNGLTQEIILPPQA